MIDSSWAPYHAIMTHRKACCYGTDLGASKHKSEQSIWRDLNVNELPLTGKYPSVEEDLEEVVGHHGVLEAVGGAVLHVERPRHLHHHQVGQAEADRGHRAGHQQPVRDPGVRPLLQPAGRDGDHLEYVLCFMYLQFTYCCYINIITFLYS